MTLLRSRATAVSAALLALFVFASPTAAQLTFNLTYQDTGTGVGFDDPSVGATRRATMTAAANFIISQIDARGTINIRFDPSNTASGVGFLGQMGTLFTVQNGYSNGLVFQRATT